MIMKIRFSKGWSLVSDVDLVHNEYSDKDLEFVGDISDRGYGSRDFRIKDNNGNVLIFNSPFINK